MTFQLTPVTGDRLVGRRADLDRLVGDLSDRGSRIGVLVTGARRAGKTSLLLEAKRRLEARGAAVVYVSVWRTSIDRLGDFAGHLLCQTLESFKGRIGLGARAPNLLAMRGGALADLLKGAKVTAEVGESITYALSFARGESSDAAGAVSDAFMLPDRLAAQCGQRCVLIIDEFPSLADLKTDGKRAVGGSIMRAVRTFNEEYRRTVLALSGSAPGAVRDAASSHSAPLYRQLSGMRIEPFGIDGVREFVSEYLPGVAADGDGGGGGTGGGGGGIRRLRDASGGLPYNLQVIGREIGRIGAGTLDAGLVDRAVGGVIAREGRVHFEAYLAAMQPAEVRVARAMACREDVGGACRPRDIVGSPGGRALAMNKVTALLSGMLAKGTVAREGAGRYRLVDPLFGAWLAAE